MKKQFILALAVVAGGFVMACGSTTSSGPDDYYQAHHQDMDGEEVLRQLRTNGTDFSLDNMRHVSDDSGTMTLRCINGDTPAETAARADLALEYADIFALSTAAELAESGVTSGMPEYQDSMAERQMRLEVDLVRGYGCSLFGPGSME